MKLEFGIPSKRQKKVDRFEGQAVLIMRAEPSVKHESRKFELSKHAATRLGFTNGGEIAVGFNDREMYIANVKINTIPTAYKLTKKTNTFSNAKLYKFMKEFYDLDTSKENVFELNIDGATDVENVISLAVVEVEEDLNFTGCRKEDINESIEDDFKELENNFESESIQTY